MLLRPTGFSARGGVGWIDLVKRCALRCAHSESRCRSQCHVAGDLPPPLVVAGGVRAGSLTRCVLPIFASVRPSHYSIAFALAALCLRIFVWWMLVDQLLSRLWVASGRDVHLLAWWYRSIRNTGILMGVLSAPYI